MMPQISTLKWIVHGSVSGQFRGCLDNLMQYLKSPILLCTRIIV